MEGSRAMVRARRDAFEGKLKWIAFKGSMVTNLGPWN